MSGTSYAFDLCPACSPETVNSQENVPDYMLGKGKLGLVGLYRLGSETNTDKHSESSEEMERALLELGFEPMGNVIVRLYRSVHVMGIFEGKEIDAAVYGSLSERFIIGLRLVGLKTPTLGLVVRL